MLTDEFLKGVRSAVQSHAMNTPRGGAYDARLRRFTRFTPRTRASDQFEEETNKSDDDRPLPMELMEIIRRQLDPDTYRWLCDALNGTGNDQDLNEEEDKPANGLSPEGLIDRICELVGPHLSDDDNEEFKRLLGGLSPNPAGDEPPSCSGRPTPGGGQDPITSESRARSSVRSPAEDAYRITSLTPGGPLAYDMGVPFTGERNGVRYLQGKQLNSRPREVSTSSLQSYAKRFPNAARIRHV